MSKKMYMGSVGKAEAFRRNANNEFDLAFVSKTLTDSGLNITTTKDDIRAGTGAPVQFSFYHDANVEITLTDVLWDPNYLQAQLGAQFTNGSEDYVTDQVTFAQGSSEVEYADYEKIHKMPIPCGEEYVVWGSPKGRDEWVKLGYDATTHKLSLNKAVTAETVYCIRYLGAVDNAKVAEITSMIVPEELFLIITAPLFAGDACSPSKGKEAGHITFEVPRFQLNGSQEFAMNMSSNQTMSLAGTALAATSEDCDSVGGKLLRIIEVVYDRSWKDDAEDIQIDAQCLEVGDEPSVYAILNNGYLKHCNNADDLTFTKDGVVVDPMTTWAAGTYTVTLKGTNISRTVTIE